MDMEGINDLRICKLYTSSFLDSSSIYSLIVTHFDRIFNSGFMSRSFFGVLWRI